MHFAAIALPTFTMEMATMAAQAIGRMLAITAIGPTGLMLTAITVLIYMGRYTGQIFIAAWAATEAITAIHPIAIRPTATMRAITQVMRRLRRTRSRIRIPI